MKWCFPLNQSSVYRKAAYTLSLYSKINSLLQYLTTDVTLKKVLYFIQVESCGPPDAQSRKKEMLWNAKLLKNPFYIKTIPTLRCRQGHIRPDLT